MIKEVFCVCVCVCVYVCVCMQMCFKHDLSENRDRSLKCFQILNGKCRADTKGEYTLLIKQERLL